MSEIIYTARERLWLSALGAVGFVVLNGAFVYGLVARPEALAAAMANPVAAAFIVEALMLTGALAYLLPRWGLCRLHWGWFVALSLLGGLAFAVPVVLLWRRRESPPGG